MTTEEAPPSEASTEKQAAEAAATTARREFLARCGRLAVITPPAVTLLLSATSRNYAVAHSGYGDPGKHKFYRKHRYHRDDDGDAKDR
jgi:hypothetical protein